MAKKVVFKSKSQFVENRGSWKAPAENTLESPEKNALLERRTAWENKNAAGVGKPQIRTQNPWKAPNKNKRTLKKRTLRRTPQRLRFKSLRFQNPNYRFHRPSSAFQRTSKNSQASQVLQSSSKPTRAQDRRYKTNCCPICKSTWKNKLLSNLSPYLNILSPLYLYRYITQSIANSCQRLVNKTYSLSFSLPDLSTEAKK